MQPMIEVRITLTGILAEMVGHHQMAYGLKPGARYTELLALMIAKRPALADMAGRFSCSLNGRQVALDTVLTDGDHFEIAVYED
ncbi:MAG: MoaD/ThiS family protein [Phycisphaerales bacterium]|nr:MoaD/ThiS family protein [Phycisphaerales bacterium]